MENDEKLNELANDFFSFVCGKSKQKKLRPFVKQFTYKNITKKWYEDNNGNVLDFVGKPKIVYDFARNENESIKEFIKRMIDEGVFK